MRRRRGSQLAQYTHYAPSGTSVELDPRRALGYLGDARNGCS